MRAGSRITNVNEVLTSGVVKKDAVRCAEPLLLGAPAVRRDSTASRDASQARLVEQTASGALIEVTCGCGKMIKVNCLYSAPGLQSPAAAAGTEMPQRQGE